MTLADIPGAVSPTPLADLFNALSAYSKELGFKGLVAERNDKQLADALAWVTTSAQAVLTEYSATAPGLGSLWRALQLSLTALHDTCAADAQGGSHHDASHLAVHGIATALATLVPTVAHQALTVASFRSGRPS